MSVPSYVVRDLCGGEVRRFKSVAHAVLWYVAQKEKRSLRGQSLERGTSRAPQSHIDEVQATYARLIVVMETLQDPADLEDDFLLFWRRIEDLARWYEHSAIHLADELGMGEGETDKYCLFTERILRRRLIARDLLQ
jgi:hypothetical protein